MVAKKVNTQAILASRVNLVLQAKRPIQIENHVTVADVAATNLMKVQLNASHVPRTLIPTPQGLDQYFNGWLDYTIYFIILFI